MYYPSSGAIVAERPELSGDVQAIEELLVDNEGSLVTLRMIEDHAQVARPVAEYVTEKFAEAGHLTEVSLPICPECDTPHEEPDEDRLRCDVCDHEFNSRTADVGTFLIPQEPEGMIHLHDIECMLEEAEPVELERSAKTSITVAYIAAQVDPATSGDVELRQIRNAVASRCPDKISLREIPAAKIEDVIQALLKQPRPAVLHYAGHGSEDDGLILPDMLGHPARVSKLTLAGMLSVLRGTVKLVFMNSCHSAVEAETIVQEVGILIGMSRAVRNGTALEFAKQFYLAVGEKGASVKEAFCMARLAIDAQFPDQADIMELHHRPDIDPTQVRLVV